MDSYDSILDSVEINTISQTESQDNNQYTSEVSRFDFSKATEVEKYNSGFSTVMNILNTLTGAEILSISNSMTFCGLVVSVILMTVTAVLSYVATIMTVRLQSRTGAKNLNDLATRLLGSKMAKVMAVLTLLFTYSCLLAYLILGCESVCKWVTMAGFNSEKGIKRIITIVVYSLVLPVALTIPRKMTFLNYFSTFSILCLFVFFVVIIFKGVQHFPKFGIAPSVKSSEINFSFFNTLAIYSLMFALPGVVLPIMKEYNPRINARYKVIGSSFVTCFLFVLIPGVIGYLMFGDDTEQIIFSSFSDADLVMQFCRASFFIVVNASYPVIALSVMSDLCSLVFKKDDPSKLAPKHRIILLCATNIPPIFLAIILPEIRPVLAIGGALGGCMTNFFFPPLMWVMNSTHKKTYWRNILYIVFSAFGLIAASIATYEAVLDAITPD